MATKPLPFEQQPRESTKAFTAFKTYLELGDQRSLSLTAARVGKGTRMMAEWSRRFDWPGRVRAHIAHLAAIERQAIEGLAQEKAVEWSRAHEAIKIAEWQRHKKLVALADEMLERWEKNQDKCGTLEGIARVLELATKLARLASGMPTEVKEVNATLTATVDVDWEMAIRKAYQTASGLHSPAEPAGKPATVVEVEEVKP